MSKDANGWTRCSLALQMLSRRIRRMHCTCQLVSFSTMTPTPSPEPGFSLFQWAADRALMLHIMCETRNRSNPNICKSLDYFEAKCCFCCVFIAKRKISRLKLLPEKGERGRPLLCIHSNAQPRTSITHMLCVEK